MDRVIVRGLNLGSALQVAEDRAAADAAATAAAVSQTAAATSATAAQTARTGAEAAQAAAEAARDDASAIVGLPSEDAAIANRINTPGSLTDVALSAAYAPLVAARPAARVIVIGDSIENLYSYRSTTSTSITEQFGGGDWPTWAMLLSGGRFQLVRNMGTGGETTTQYLARYDADVAPSVGAGTHDQANVVVIGGQENDIQQSGYSLTTYKANIIEMVRRTRVLGAVPVLRTTMPHFLSAAVRTKIGAANQWIRNYGASQGLVVLDFWRIAVDPATGQYRSNMSSDGVHPNELTARAMGQYAADVLAEAMPSVAVSALASDPTDTGLLAPTPLFTTSSSGTPTGWNAINGSPSGVTRSMITDPLVPGQMARHTHAGSSTDNIGTANNSGAIDTDVAAPGDILQVSGVLTSDGGVQATVNVTINYNDGTAKNIGRAIYFTKAVTRGYYSFRLPALPAGFTNVIVTFLTNQGTGVVDFAYPTVRNLTAEGAL